MDDEDIDKDLKSLTKIMRELKVLAFQHSFIKKRGFGGKIGYII